MNQNILEQSARLVLPKEFPDYFGIVKIETEESDTDAMSMTIYLDERMNAYLQKSGEYGSKGFMDAVSITDFPIRDHTEDVIKALKHIPAELLDSVDEVTLDLSDSMRKIVHTCFPGAMRVIDRSHIQKQAVMPYRKCVSGIDVMLFRKQTMTWKMQSLKDA